jgi:CheY-like chemotaxis protein
MLGDEVVQRDSRSAAIAQDNGENPSTSNDDDLEAFGQMRKPCILVVDDYVADARLLRRLLEMKQRFEVIEAHSGMEALTIVEKTPPDLIILDLILPDISGEQLLDMFRRRPETQNTPIVIVSAKEIDPTTRAHLVTRVDSVWSKSVLDRNSLLAHIETILPE